MCQKKQTICLGESCFFEGLDATWLLDTEAIDMIACLLILSDILVDRNRTVLLKPCASIMHSFLHQVLESLHLAVPQTHGEKELFQFYSLFEIEHKIFSQWMFPILVWGTCWTECKEPQASHMPVVLCELPTCTLVPGPRWWQLIPPKFINRIPFKNGGTSLNQHGPKFQITSHI